MNYSYQCNLRFCDSPDFARLIMIYKSVKSKEPPVEGDLITLTFNSTGKESFFYEWIISGEMYDGEIEFVCNEVDVVDIFRFWDCYCIGIEENMGIGGTSMTCTVYLSPGIIKRNNLPVREKVWKVSNPSTDKKVAETDDAQESKEETSKENATFVSNSKKVAENTKSVSVVMAISVIHVTPPFILKKKFQNEYYESEMRRQLLMQETGINNLTIFEWLKNRRKFKKLGRDPDSNKYQQAFRDQYRQKKIYEYLLQEEDDVDIKIIEAKVDAELEELVGLHNPDQIAGGNIDDVQKMGNKRINSSIGSQWGTKDKGRAQNLEDEVLRIIAGPPPINEEEQKKIKMNVSFVDDLKIINE